MISLNVTVYLKEHSNHSLTYPDQSRILDFFFLPQIIHQTSKSHYVSVRVFICLQESAQGIFFAIVEICNPCASGICTTFLPNLSRNMINPSSCPAQAVQESDRRPCFLEDRRADCYISHASGGGRINRSALLSLQLSPFP